MVSEASFSPPPRVHSEKFRAWRPSLTWFVIHHDSGATSSHQYVAVSLLWQSKHAATASRRVRVLSHVGSCWVDGLSTRYGTNWISPKSTTMAAAEMRKTRARRPLRVARELSSASSKA